MDNVLSGMDIEVFCFLTWFSVRQRIVFGSPNTPSSVQQIRLLRRNHVVFASVGLGISFLLCMMFPVH